MTNTSTAPIVGKWKLVETRDDLDNPKSAKKGGRGEIVEFTVDGRMRRPGEKESRSKAFGSVLYCLNPKKSPPHFDTRYASGEALRTGIYRLEGDRLIICWTQAEFGKGRPSKFGRFAMAEKDLLRHVDIYERVTNCAPEQTAAAKPAVKLPSGRLLEAGRLLAYLRKSRKQPPRNLGTGVESAWIPLAELEVISGCLWAGDPLCMNEEDGCLTKLPKGLYVMAAQGLDFGGFRIVGRLRVYPKGLRADRLKTGRAIGEAGTDSAAITVCDLRALLPAIAGLEEPFLRELEKQVRDACALLTSKRVPGIALPYVQSGFGDGAGPVLALLSAGKRVGVHLDFTGGTDVTAESDECVQRNSLLGQDTNTFKTWALAGGGEASFWVGGQLKAGAKLHIWTSAPIGPAAYRIRLRRGRVLKDWVAMRAKKGGGATFGALEVLKAGRYEIDFRIGSEVFSAIIVTLE